MVLENNLCALEHLGRYGRILEYFKNTNKEKDYENKEIDVEITDAKNGEPVVCYQDTELHCLNSIYNPSHAAERFLQDFMIIPDNAGLIMYGLSSGVYAQCFLRGNKNSVFCLVYEPCIDIFRAVMESVNISELLTNPRFFLVVEGINDGDFSHFLEIQNRFDNRYQKKYVALPGYKTLFLNGYKNYLELIHQNEETYQILINTALQLGERICYTGIQNMRYLPGCRSGHDYVNYFPTDLPAIIVSAGPSLEKNVDLLKSVYGRALIIVVDSAIRTVFRRGIKPNFVITVDNNKELKNFDVDGLAGTFLLADMAANTEAFDKIKPENLVFYSSGYPIWNRLFKEEGTHIQEIYSGGSVALDAITFSIIMGFKKIILIGQDLALTDGKQYADGTKIDAQDIKGNIVVKDIFGNDILTKADYYSFIKCIETLAYQHPDVEIIDATEGGAIKKYTTIMTLRDAIDTYCSKEYDLDTMIENVPRRFVNHGVEKVMDTLKKMKIHIQTIEQKMAIGAEKCADAAQMLFRKDYDKEKLSEINTYIRQLDDDYVNMEEGTLFSQAASNADYAFMTYIYDVEDNDIAESIRLYKKSEQYYRGIAETAPKIIAMIDECIEKTKLQYGLD